MNNWMNCAPLCDALAALWVSALIGTLCGIGKMIRDVISERKGGR